MRLAIAHARDALVNTLAKFTCLESLLGPNSVGTATREMRPKNVECVRVLLAIALSDGDRLGSSW